MAPYILVIDDNELILVMAKAALEKVGYSVVTASNGIEANKHIFSKNKPGLIIMDVMMPLLDGNKKAAMLKQSEFSRDIPILLLSSKSEPEMRTLVQETGAQGYILKPFSVADIAGNVARFVQAQ